jgi:nucleotide-binding universal stress UspA family protein
LISINARSFVFVSFIPMVSKGRRTMKSIILHVHGDEGFSNRMDVALDLCRAHDAHLTCIHVTPYAAYASFDAAGGMFASGVLIEELNKQQATMQADVEKRLAHEDVRWDWQSYDGDVAQTLVSASALADLVVLGQAGAAPRSGNAALPIVDDVSVNAGCAVLVVPEGCNRFQSTAPAVIGWNASEQSARAIRQTLPMLKLASSVHLVSISVADDDFPQLGASSYLSRHGISSELHIIDAKGRNSEEELHRFAVNQGAGMLLIGAYGHSRLRETLLGGVTRFLTLRAQLPLVLGR